MHNVEDTLLPLISPIDVFQSESLNPLVLCCDHGGNLLPEGIEGLGIAEQEMKRHIAWDIGAAAVTIKIATNLQAAAVCNLYSRLYWDCNRPPGSIEATPAYSDGIKIPFNQGILDAERLKRMQRVHWPYHQRLSEVLSNRWQGSVRPLLVSIHSFTPKLMDDETSRSWHMGLISGHDRRLAEAMLANYAYPHIPLGDNLPYSGFDVSYTLDVHGLSSGIPHIGIEIRQDLISDMHGIAKYAEILSEWIDKTLQNTIFNYDKYY